MSLTAVPVYIALMSLLAAWLDNMNFDNTTRAWLFSIFARSPGQFGFKNLHLLRNSYLQHRGPSIER